MIKSVELTNAGPFRGHHRIDLGPGAYAVTARHDLDARRSNGIGKSFLLEIIYFAVTGLFRKERGYDADGWVTRGEREGRVVVELEDGTRIERWKTKGQPRQVRAWLPGRAEAAQDEAQEAVIAHLCASAEELRRGPYVEQKEASRMVHADPSERSRIVRAWLGLASAEAAEDEADARVTQAGEEYGRARAARDAVAAGIAALEDTPQSAEDAPGTPSSLRAEAAAIDATLDRQAGLERAAGVVARHEAAVAELKGLRCLVEDGRKRDLAGQHEAAQTNLREAHAAVRAAEAEARARKKVALGQFDGSCPVAPIACPARAQINGMGEETRRAAAEAQEVSARAGTAFKAASDAAAPVAAAYDGHAAAERAEPALAAKVKAGLDEVREARALAAWARMTPAEVSSARAERARLLAAAGAIEGAARQRALREAKLVGDRKKLAAAEAEVAAAEGRQRLAARARAVMRAAQRRVAEPALAEIEARANAAIVSAGAELTVRATWEREGKAIARACDDCGAAFPSSAKVKACERCGAARGLTTKQRLDFRMSEASGALDDLAGVAWQLSAGAWLLSTRGSPWATAMLDECTAAMDAGMREGLVHMVGRLVGGGGHLRQALVISHSQATVDALPRRIEISCGADGERRIAVL